MATTVHFTVRSLNGTPIPFTNFRVESGARTSEDIYSLTLPAPVVFTTDEDGEATLSLEPSIVPYYITKPDQGSDELIAYKFFVPVATTTLDADLLYVDLGKYLQTYNDASLHALIEAKVSVLTALNNAVIQGNAATTAASAVAADKALIEALFVSMENLYDLMGDLVKPNFGVREEHIATDGQTVIEIISAAYYPANESLQVYVNGLLQDDVTSYVVSLPNIITFTEGLALGDVVTLSFNSEPLIIPNSNVINFLQAGTGVATRTVQDELRETFKITQFNASPSNTPAQNDVAFAAAAAHALLSSANYDTVTLKVPAGIYEYTTSPNWAIPRLTIECEYGTVFKHTGSGNAMVFDGGATGGGVFVVALKGNPLIMGNASTTNAVYNRAVHNSAFEFRVRDASTSVLKTEWAVCNEYTIRCSPLGEPAFSVIPANGLVLDKRGAGEMTSACTFYNPILEGLTTGYGIALSNAVQNTFIGGTSESNGGGVTISATSSSNTFHNMDCEFNTFADFFVQGAYNTFVNAYSDSSSTFSGIGNLVVGGTFNTVVSSGVNNEFHRLTYGAAGGSFTDSGTATVKLSVRNAGSGNLDVDLQGNAKSLTRIAGNGGTHDLLIGADNLITGGPSSTTTFYKYGGGNVSFYNGSSYVIQIGSDALGFFNSTPVAKPNVSGSKGGNAALGSLIDSLEALGLIVDSTS